MKITIRGYAFTLTEPYQALHTLSPTEAQTLNSLRAENIRNVVAKLVIDSLDSDPNRMLRQEELDEIQTKITRYDHEYVFRPRHEPKPKPHPIEELIRQIAREHARAEAAQTGLPLDPALISERAIELASDPVIRVEAEKRHLHLTRVANASLDGML